jgi:hypothetical protein
LAVDKNDGLVKTAKCGLKAPSHAPTDFDFAESFGVSEYLPFWRPPFNLIRLFEVEDE